MSYYAQPGLLGRRRATDAIIAPPQAKLLIGRQTSQTTTNPLQWNQRSYDYGSIMPETGGVMNANATITIPASLDGALMRFIANTGTPRDDQQIQPKLGGASARGFPINGSYAGATFGGEAVNIACAPRVFSTGQTIDLRQKYGSAGTAGEAYADKQTWAALERLDTNAKRALFYKTSAQALLANTPHSVFWEGVEYNTGGFTQASGGASIVIPAALNGKLVRITCGIKTSIAAATRTSLNLTLFKNDAKFQGGFWAAHSTLGDHGIVGTSAVLLVSAGDYFNLVARSAAAQNINAVDETFFYIEEVSASVKTGIFVMSANQSMAAYTPAPLQFGADPVYDNSGGVIHDKTTNNHRFTCPAGYNRGRLTMNVWSSGIGFYAQGRVNGGYPFGMPTISTDSSAATSGGGCMMNAMGAVIVMAPGDYFDINAQIGSGGGLFLSGTEYAMWACPEFWAE